MDGHFPEAVVTEYAAFAGDLDLPDPGDRHVLAAAIKGRADVIVTRNLRHFPAACLAPHALAAEHPDAFIVGLLETDPDSALAAVRGHRPALRRPSRTAGEHLAQLNVSACTGPWRCFGGIQDAV